MQESTLQGAEDGFGEVVDRDHSAYVFLLRDPDGRLLGAVGILCRESRQGGDPRPSRWCRACCVRHSNACSARCSRNTASATCNAA